MADTSMLITVGTASLAMSLPTGVCVMMRNCFSSRLASEAGKALLINI